MSETDSLYGRMVLTTGLALLISTMASIAASNGLSLVHVAKLFLMFDGGVPFGWIFIWLWGWSVWWVNVLMFLMWLTDLGVILQAVSFLIRPNQGPPPPQRGRGGGGGDSRLNGLDEIVHDMETSGDSFMKDYAKKIREAQTRWA